MLDENITGLKSINELEELLIKHDYVSIYKLNTIKKKYITYIINNYFDGNFDKIYNEFDIKDQDIDLGSKDAIEKLIIL